MSEPLRALVERAAGPVVLAGLLGLSLVLPPATFGALCAVVVAACAIVPAYRWGLRDRERRAAGAAAEAFNRFGLALSCPVTRGGAFARGQASTVALSGAGLSTDGVVLCNQVRTMDWRERHAQFIEAAPAELVADVLARVATLID